MLRAHRGPVEAKKSAALEDAIDDRIGEIVVVKDSAPTTRMFIGREDHRATSDVAIVDDVIEDVRGIVAVGEVADFIDDEHVRLDVASERFVHATLATRGRELFDESGSGREERIETVLHRAIRERDGEVCLSTTRLAFENDGATFGDEVGREERADRRESKRGLIAEVEFFDGAKERKRSAADGAHETRAATMRDFLGEEREKKALIRPLFFLCSLDEIAPSATRVGEVETLEKRREIVAHETPRVAARMGSVS